MDYSLLLGVCKQPYLNRERGGVKRPLSASATSTFSGEEATDDNISVPFFRVDDGGMAAAVIEGPGAYHLGLIDILQVYDTGKRVRVDIIGHARNNM